MLPNPDSHPAKRPNTLLPSQEGLQREAVEKRPRARIETLADLIFGLSLSVGSVAAIASSPTTPAEIGSHILAFMFTFLLLITAWLIYTGFMSVLPVETRTIVFLNVALLLLVTLIPYLLNSVEFISPSVPAADASAIKDVASLLFALDFTGILVIMAVFAHVLSLEEKKLVAPELAKLFRNGRNRMAALAVLTAISIAPPFGQVLILGVPARLFMWYVPLVSYWVGRAVSPESRTYKISRAE